MRIIDADAIPWTANGCGHPNCKDICESTKNDGGCCGWLVAHKRDVDLMPTVDVEQEIHGEWVLHGNDDDMGSTYFCSQCNFQLDSDLFYSGYEGGKWVENNVFKYCPNCGAKMDGERKEE